MTIQPLIGYILDPAWVSEHCLNEATISIAENDSSLKSYESIVKQSCCAPNPYLHEHNEFLSNAQGECLLPGLFNPTPSADSMKLLEQSITNDPGFAFAIVQKSILDAKDQPKKSYISHIGKLLAKDRPSFSSVIIKALADYPVCIDEMSTSSAELLLSWLGSSPLPNETLFILSKYFIQAYSSGDSVVSISDALKNPRFADARLASEKEFLLTISEGRIFKPEVFENFDAHVKAGRVTRETIGFLAHAAKYELYTPPREISIEWFKFFLQDSMQHLLREDLSPKEKEKAQDEQATLAFDALTRLMVLELDRIQASLSYISEIVEYVIANEGKFLQIQYGLRLVLHKLISASEKATDKAEFMKIINQIVQHDETVPKSLLNNLDLTGAPTKDLPKDRETLLRETLALNQDNPTIDQKYLSDLLEYVNTTMQEIEKKTKEFGFDKHKRIVLNLYHKKPGEIKQNEIHLYNRDGKIFIRMFDANNLLVDIEAKDLSKSETMLFKRVLRAIKKPRTNDNKIICRIAGCNPTWSNEQFTSWGKSLKTVDDSTIAEIITVLTYAYHITAAKEKFFIREHQILAILLLYKIHEGLLLQVETGGGKSLIIAIFNAIEGVYGLTGHTITINPTLAKRDAKNQKGFFDKLNISLSHNIGRSETTLKDCYSADRVYCDIKSLLGDRLRNLHEHVMEKSDPDTRTFDEVDLQALINAVLLGKKILLSDHIPGFEYFKPALQLVWANLDHMRYTLFRLGYEFNSDNQTWIPQNTTEHQILTIEEMNNRIRDSVTLAVSDILGTTALPIPVHLRHFLEGHVKCWAESSLKAVIYKKGREYIIYNNTYAGRSSKIIAPINFETGDIQSSLTLSDALTQLLQIKESLHQTSEGITTVFESYLHAFDGIFFGLSGTIGKPWYQKFFYDVYGVASIILPTFIESKLVNRPMIIAHNEADWLSKIVKGVYETSSKSRATLVVAQTINEVRLIVESLKESKYEGNIYEYYDSEKQQDVIEKRLRPGDVIVATNAAGRGTDLKITRIVEMSGGLNIIQTFFAEFLRVYLQTRGRGARNGEQGTSVVIINSETYPELIRKCDYNVTCFDEVRDDREITILKHLLICSIPGRKLEDWLFQEHVRHLRINTSPTGFEIVALQGDVIEVALQNQTNGQLYLYSSSAQPNWFRSNNVVEIPKIYLKAPESNPIDITDIISQIDSKILAHVRTVLSRQGMTLNGRGYELIHFIAAYHALSQRGDIVGRVIAEYERLWSMDSQNEDRSCPGAIGDLVEPKERIFLKNLIDQPDAKDNTTLTCPTLPELELIKFKELFRLWNKDRKLYHSKQFIQESNQQFGMHYKKHLHLMLPHTECNSSDIEGETQRDLDRAKELRNVFKIFFDACANGSLTNPAYMLHKAYAYEKIYSQQQAWFGNIPPGSQANITIIGKYGFLPKDDRSFFERTASVVFGLFEWVTDSSTFKTLQSGFVPISEVYMANPLTQAFNFAKKASVADDYYNWWGHNAVSYFIICHDGRNIIDAEDAKKAVEALKAFADHQNTAAQRLNQYIDLRDGYLSKMLMEGFVKRTSELAMQEKSEIELMRGLARAMLANIDTVRKIFSNFEDNPSILEVQKIIAGTSLMKFVDREAIMDFYKHNSSNEISDVDTENAFDISDIENFVININKIRTNQTSDNLEQPSNRSHNLRIANLSSLIANFTETNIDALLASTINELSAAGAFIGVYIIRDLKQDEDWMGTIFSIVLGVVQVAAGIIILGPIGVLAGGVASAFATTAIATGIEDIIEGVFSIAKGAPIDIDEYFKSKAISLAINLITAGALHVLSSISLLNIAANNDFLDILRIGPTGYLAKQVLFQIAMQGLNKFTQSQARNYMKSNGGNLEADAKTTAQDLVNDNYDPYLRRIFAHDAANQDGAQVSALGRSAKEITQDYDKRFQNTGTRTARGVISKTVGGVLGGFGVTGAIISSVANAAMGTVLGLVKVAEASKEFRHEMKRKIISQYDSLPGSRDMMLSYLEIDGDPAVNSNAVAILEQLKTVNFITDEEINYRNCATITSLNLATFDYARPSITVNCNRIATYMGAIDDHLSNRENLQQGLFDTFTNSLTEIFTDEVVQSSMNLPTGFVADVVSEAAVDFFKLNKPKQVPIIKSGTKYEGVADQISANQESTTETSDAPRIAFRNKPWINPDEWKNPDDAPTTQTYKVIPGDTVSDIAVKYGTTVDELIAANPTLVDNPDLIYAGSAINIPEGIKIQTPQSDQTKRTDDGTLSQSSSFVAEENTPATPDVANTRINPDGLPMAGYLDNSQGINTNGESSSNGNEISNNNPTIRFFARDIKNAMGLYQHGYTIFTYSDGKQFIVTSTADNGNIVTGNLGGGVFVYDRDNLKLGRFPKLDWKDEPRTLIQTWEIANDEVLTSYLLKVKKW